MCMLKISMNVSAACCCRITSPSIFMSLLLPILCSSSHICCCDVERHGEALQMGCGKSDLIFWSGTFLWALSQCWLYSWSRELQHILLEAGGYFYVSFFAHLKEGPLRPGCWGFTPHHGLSSQGLSSLAANPMMLCGNFTLLSWSFLPTLLITVPMLPLTQ